MATTGSGGDLLGKVLNEAESKLQQNFLGNTPDNCANFVRACFRDAGYILPETRSPSDLAICQRNGYPLGPGYANSLAGNEIGRKLPVDQAQPGDIVLFLNLGASSSFAQGSITHVGICVGDNMMIDHGESGMHKRNFRDWPGSANFAEARRPKLFDVTRTRIQLKDGKLTQFLHNAAASKIDILVNLSTSPGGGLQVLVDGLPVKHYKAVWLRLSELATGKMYLLAYQHGHTSASVNGTNISALKCQMSSSAGALHVRVNDKEVRSHDAAIEIVYV